ncbi:hypothetical protein JCM8547_009369 [Rhodosporidiobolus lusitaniae]
MHHSAAAAGFAPYHPAPPSSFSPIPSTSSAPYGGRMIAPAAYGGPPLRMAYPQQQAVGPESTGIRRARSSQALSSIPPRSSGYAYPMSPMPPSPVSPTYRDARMQPPPPDANWFAASRNAWLEQNQHFSPPSAASPASGAYGSPQTPIRRKRNASAQAALPTPSSAPRATYGQAQPLSVAIPEYTAPAMSYSHTTPAATTPFKQPTAEEVSQFFRDMTDILGEEAMAALSPSSPNNAYASLSALSPSAPSAPPATAQPAKPTYNVSGVLLSEEEYRQYAASPSPAPSASHAQPFIPPSTNSSTPHRQEQPSFVGDGTFYPSQQYGWEVPRPQTAPPTPSTETVLAFPAYGSYQPSPPRDSVPLNRRRGSSLDMSSIPRSIPTGMVVSPPPSYPPQQQQQTPYGNLVPRDYAPPPLSQSYYSSPAYYSSALPSFSSHDISPSSQTQHRIRRSVSPTSRLSSSSSASGNGSKRKKSAVAFINFSAADSKTLLNGVAPSGNSKKRQREEEEKEKKVEGEGEGKRQALG